jgi:hypothetical protein
MNEGRRMKKICLSIFLISWSFSLFSQGNSTGCKMIEDKIDEVIDLNNSLCLMRTESKIENFKNFLNQDNTDEREYVSDAIDRDKWFICLHFASQLYFRGSCFANKSDVPKYEEKTSLDLRTSSSIQKNHLPIFSVNITSKKIKFFHQINALFIGSNKAGLKDLNNFYFVEPQTDVIFRKIEELKGAYSEISNMEDFTITISLMDSPTYSSQGALQYRTRDVIKFLCSN